MVAGFNQPSRLGAVREQEDCLHLCERQSEKRATHREHPGCDRGTRCCRLGNRTSQRLGQTIEVVALAVRGCRIKRSAARSGALIHELGGRRVNGKTKAATPGQIDGPTPEIPGWLGSRSVPTGWKDRCLDDIEVQASARVEVSWRLHPNPNLVTDLGKLERSFPGQIWHSSSFEVCWKPGAAVCAGIRSRCAAYQI